MTFGHFLTANEVSLVFFLDEAEYGYHSGSSSSSSSSAPSSSPASSATSGHHSTSVPPTSPPPASNNKGRPTPLHILNHHNHLSPSPSPIHGRALQPTTHYPPTPPYRSTGYPGIQGGGLHHQQHHHLYYHQSLPQSQAPPYTPTPSWQLQSRQQSPGIETAHVSKHFQSVYHEPTIGSSNQHLETQFWVMFALVPPRSQLFYS